MHMRQRLCPGCVGRGLEEFIADYKDSNFFTKK